MKFAELKIGMRESLTKTFTAIDVKTFSEISLDANPIHIDEEYAKRTPFGKCIVHGMLVCGLISAVLASKLPGEGTIYLGQEVRFTSPVYLGDTITAAVEISELRDDKKIVKLITLCTNQNDKTVVTGTATVKID